jgi:hypothetical protein
MTNMIENNPAALYAALITGGTSPAISDVIEILRYLAGMENAITASRT